MFGRVFSGNSSGFATWSSFANEQWLQHSVRVNEMALRLSGMSVSRDCIVVVWAESGVWQAMFRTECQTAVVESSSDGIVRIIASVGRSRPDGVTGSHCETAVGFRIGFRGRL